ncbi:2083_t:CDS:2, partial [Gigaspora rosea]
INKNLHKALLLAQMPNFSIMPLALSTIIAPNTKSHYANTVTNIKKLKTTIWTSRNWEKNAQQSEHIKFYTNRRYNDFRDNTSRMLDSILKRNNDHISFEKIVLPDNVITNQKEIKEVIRNHYSKWSKETLPNPDYQEEWKSYYTPLEKIDNRIYDRLMTPFELDDLINTINEAPTHKAPGPQMGKGSETMAAIKAYIDPRTHSYKQKRTLAALTRHVEGLQLST